MKHYKLLGHIFELDHHAHAFLERYIERIEHYAHENNIANDILEDIKYNIIEKLYKSPTPINEQTVMTIASDLGEPEQIFGNGDSEPPHQPKNLLEQRFGTNKPMIRGVCYWIAKSFQIPVTIVRIAMLVLVFIYGISVWIYPLLALFVPFSDKKSSSGTIGSAIFEFIRIIIRLGVLLFLGLMILMTGSLFFIGLIPNVSGQSIQSLIPDSIYVLAGLSIVSMIVLWIGSLGAALKKHRLPKPFAMVAIIIIIGSAISGGYFISQKAIQFYTYDYTNNVQTIMRQHVEGDSLHIQITDLYGRSSIHDDRGDIRIVQSIDGNVSINVINKRNPQLSDEDVSRHWSEVSTTISGKNLHIQVPTDLFSQTVPFVGALRDIEILVPADKTITLDNRSQMTVEVREKKSRTKEYTNRCADQTTLQFDQVNQERACTNTSITPSTPTQPQTNNTNIMPNESLEDYIERKMTGLTVDQAFTLAGELGHAIRVGEQDDRELPLTADFVPGRVTIEVHNGIVTDVDVE